MSFRVFIPFSTSLTSEAKLRKQKELKPAVKKHPKRLFVSFQEGFDSGTVESAKDHGVRSWSKALSNYHQIAP